MYYFFNWKEKIILKYQFGRKKIKTNNLFRSVEKQETKTPKVNQREHARWACPASPGNKWPCTGEVVWDIMVIIISLGPWHFCRAAGYVLPWETPYGLMAGFVGKLK